MPIIFILSSGADPLAEIMKFAKEKGKNEDDIPKKSLGKGQEKDAGNAIKMARTSGKWIILQNCHMCPSFMPILEASVVETSVNEKKYKKKDEDSKEEEENKGEVDDDPDKVVNENFRFWITTMPDEKFPT